MRELCLTTRTKRESMGVAMFSFTRDSSCPIS